MSGEPVDFVRGKGVFLDDLRFPEMLHLRLARSLHARARLLRVAGGFDGRELRARLPAGGEGATPSASGVAEPALAQEEVHYVGQPVAAVLGATPEAAEDLLASVEVDYEPLDPVPDVAAALALPPFHPGLPSNVMSEFWLGAEFERPATPLLLEESFRIARVAANPMETRGALARFDAGRLTVYVSTQSVYSVRNGLGAALGLAPESVRVVQTDTGGAFGAKGSNYPEYVVAAYAAMKTGRPVKWVETRTEHLTSSRHGRGAEADVRLFAERDGTIRALEADVRVDGGAYLAGLNAGTSRFIAFQLVGPYGIPQARVHARSFYTNRVPLGPYRGAGRPEAAYLLERMVDRLADEAGLDPVEVRRRNATTTTTRSPLGLEVEPSRPFLEEAVEALGYERARGPGVGLSLFVLVPAVAPGDSARLKVASGTLTVWTGTHNHGQAHRSWIRELLVRELGVARDTIVVENADTDALNAGIGTWGSRSAMVGGAAVIAAARALRDRVTGDTGGYDAARLLAGSWDVTVFEPLKGQMNALGANLVKASVDRTGTVTVDEVRAYYDVGRALNRGAIESQVAGGTLQAVGQTLVEEVVYDERAQVLSMSLADAGVAAALPEVRVVVGLAEHPSPLPHGARGVGESPTVGVPPALVRAVETASGVRLADLPVRASWLMSRIAGRRRKPMSSVPDAASVAP